ncbi:myelin-oligodendrocyte glycoprotein-like isoform X2 [Oryzias latipes]
MKIFYLLSLIPLVVEGLSGSSEMVCSPSTVQAHPGQNMTVLCRVEPSFNVSAVTLECKHGSKNLHIRRSHGDNPDDQDLMFKGRTSLIPQGNGTFTVTLTNVTKQDEGNYSCSLPEHGICSNVIPMKILQTNNETDNHPGSALSSGEITAIGVLGGVLLLGVVGILAFRYCRRNRFCFHRSEGCFCSGT